MARAKDSYELSSPDLPCFQQLQQLSLVWMLPVHHTVLACQDAGW